ncbi:MAG: hypothetical protein GY822_31855 [Deltaproteobacteria bacterium]|nr:hypothetical protein [Deltaproteobacteria bacterium]
MERFGLSTLQLALLILVSCAPTPTDECVVYVACQKEFAADFGGAELDLTIYEEGGDCWRDTASADSCTSACSNATQTLIDATENTAGGTPSSCQ